MTTIINWIIETLYIIPGIVIGLCFHEFAHAYVADRCGDPTPRNMGRVSLSPRAHFDLLGLLSLILIHFGWGKPVMINPRNFKNRHKSVLLVSIAGICMNLVIAFCFGGFFGLLYRFAPSFYSTSIGDIVRVILLEVVYINVGLAFFNLIPVPPLDGFNFITELFELQNTKFYYFMQKNGRWILILFIVFDVPEMLISDLVTSVSQFFLTLFL